MLGRGTLIGLCVTAALSLALAGTARGQDVVYHHAPDRLFGFPSDTSDYDIDGNPSSELEADDFSLTQGTTICGLNWWAFFGGDDTAPGNIYPPATETLRVRFYGDAAGLPGAVLTEQTVVDPQRIATGFEVIISPNRPEYLYSVALSPCFSAAANTTYWLEVTQIGDLDSTYRWETSQEGIPHAFQFPIGTAWRLSRSQYGLAFQLRQSPEPTVSTLLLLTCFSFAMRNSRRPTKNR